MTCGIALLAVSSVTYLDQRVWENQRSRFGFAATQAGLTARQLAVLRNDLAAGIE